MKKTVAFVVVGLLSVAGVATATTGDQGRRLSGPFCVDLKDGIVHAVPKGHQCSTAQIAKPGVAVSGPAGPIGPAGPAGHAGANGANGGQGGQGAQGASVTMKPILSREEDYEEDYPCKGASAYDGQIGVTLTIGDQSLVVCNGRPGARGQRGYKGEQGDKGDKGEDGEDGEDAEYHVLTN